MRLDFDLLRKAKRENLERLARSMGIPVPRGLPHASLCARITMKATSLAIRDELERMLEKRNHV